MRDFKQRENIDYNKIFALMIKFINYKIIFALTTIFD